MSVNGNIPYIVVWSYRVEHNGSTLHVSEHFTFDDFAEACAQYERLQKHENVVDLHMCLPFRSTDYNTITVWA